MSDTPISDSTPHNVADLGMLVRRLERELTAANYRIKRLEDALECIREYWNRDNNNRQIVRSTRSQGGQAVSDTPRTDAAYFKPHATMYDLAGEMKLMERELNAVTKERDDAVFVTEKVLRDFSEHSRSHCKALDELIAANQRIKRLEEAGDKLSDCADQIGWTSCESPQWIKKAENAVKEWRKAKEAKL